MSILSAGSIALRQLYSSVKLIQLVTYSSIISGRNATPAAQVP